MIASDVLIIGGGPAGSSCARALTRAGLRVIVLDKAAFPRDKTCAGWITPPVLEALEIDPDEYRSGSLTRAFGGAAGGASVPVSGRGGHPGGRTLQPIRAFRTSRIGDADVHTSFDRIVSFGIRRCEFDHYLLQRSGAEVRAGEPLVSLRRDERGSRWIANEARAAIAAPIVVGAGGHFCPVARWLGGASIGDEPIVAAQEIEVVLTPEQAEACPIAADTPELFLTRDLKGYGWCFRKERVLNVGLGRQDRHDLGRHVRDFVATLVAAGKLPRDLDWPSHPAAADRVPTPIAHRTRAGDPGGGPGSHPAAADRVGGPGSHPAAADRVGGPGWKGHAYLIHGTSRRRLIDDGMLLIGDAAGFAYPRSGEGIRPAVESGLMAAQTILAANLASNGRYDRESLEPYRARVRARFGRGETPGAWSQLPESFTTSIAARLLAMPWFAREVFLTRWFLHAHEPAHFTSASNSSTAVAVS